MNPLLSPEDLKWLKQHGGREEKHVLWDDKGKCVLMGDGHGGMERVYF